MAVINERLGEIRLNSFGTKMKIVRYNSSDDVSVEFMDEHHYSTTTNYSNFKNGNIKNPYDKTIFGIGYLGNGKYATKINRVMLESYRVWYDMMRRCYSIKSKEKFSAYFGICSVAEIWHNYQNFAEKIFCSPITECIVLKCVFLHRNVLICYLRKNQICMAYLMV